MGALGQIAADDQITGVAVSILEVVSVVTLETPVLLGARKTPLDCPGTIKALALVQVGLGSTLLTVKGAVAGKAIVSKSEGAVAAQLGLVPIKEAFRTLLPFYQGEHLRKHKDDNAHTHDAVADVAAESLCLRHFDPLVEVDASSHVELKVKQLCGDPGDIESREHLEGLDQTRFCKLHFLIVVVDEN